MTEPSKARDVTSAPSASATVASAPHPGGAMFSGPVNRTVRESLKLTDVGCGGEHSIAVGADGNMYTCGCDENGRLGYRNTGKTTISNFRCVPSSGITITNVAAGEFHSIAGATDGRVFSFGSGSLGQLGLGTTADKWVPCEIRLFRHVASSREPAKRGVKSVCCGEFHSVVCTGDGKAFTFGLNCSGQLGLDRKITNAVLSRSDECQKHSESYGFGARSAASRSVAMVKTPTEVVIPSCASPIVKVSAGARHTLFLDSRGVVYGCGSNLDGQLGTVVKGPSRSPDDLYATVPGRLFDLDADKTLLAADISAGGYHSGVLTVGGDLLVCGRNDTGQLGVGSSSKQLGFIRVAFHHFAPNSHITHLSFGAAHSVVGCDTGEVFVCGWASRGRLGIGECGGKNYINVFSSVRASPAMDTPSPRRAAMATHFDVSSCETSLMHPNAEQLPRIKKIAAGGHHTIVLYENGGISSFGCGGRGQLGNGDWADVPWFPTEPTIPTVTITRRAVVIQQVAQSGSLETTVPHNINKPAPTHDARAVPPRQDEDEPVAGIRSPREETQPTPRLRPLPPEARRALEADGAEPEAANPWSSEAASQGAS